MAMVRFIINLDRWFSRVECAAPAAPPVVVNAAINHAIQNALGMPPEGTLIDTLRPYGDVEDIVEVEDILLRDMGWSLTTAIVKSTSEKISRTHYTIDQYNDLRVSLFTNPGATPWLLKNEQSF